MLFRCLVVWLFALATLLGAPSAGIKLESARGPVSFDIGSSSHTVSLLPSSEPCFNSLRPHSDSYELQPPQPSTLIAHFSLVGECPNNRSPNEALGSLCRGIPVGQAPPSVC